MTTRILPALLLAVAPLHAATVFSDDFSGTGAVSLNGLTPDTTTGGAVWSAHAGLRDNGVPVNADDSSALLPLTPESDKIYTLSVVLTAGAGTEDNDWLGFGFNFSAAVAGAGATPAQNAGRFTDAGQNGRVWAIIREAASNATNDQDIQFFTSGTAAQIATTETDASFNGQIAHTATIELNTAGGLLTTRLLIDGTDMTNGFQAVPGVAMADIKGVGITHNNVTNAGVGFDSFTLTVVPEPSSALLGLAGAGLLLRRRRA